MIELPGPSLKLSRSGMRIKNGGGGILGQYRLPNEDVQLWKLDREAKLLGEFRPGIFREASISGNGSVYLAGPKGLYVLGQDGKLKQLNENDIYLLVASKSDEVWANRSGQAGFVLYNSVGDILGNYPGKSGANLVLSEAGEVCFYGDDKPSGLRLLNAAGKISAVDGFDLGPFDEILAFGNGHLQNKIAGGILFQMTNSESKTLPLINAGLDSETKAFISGYDAGKVFLKREGEAAKWLEIPKELQNGPRPFYAIAIENETIWVRGDAYLLQFSSKGRMESQVALNNENLEAETLNKAWSLTQILGMSGNSTMLSCVGPQGIAIVRIELN